MRIAFMSWRDLANEQAGGSEVFIDRLAVALQGHGPRGRSSLWWPSGCSGRIPCSIWEGLTHNMRGLHSCTTGWREIGISWSTPRMDSPTFHPCGEANRFSHAFITFTANSGASGSLLPWPPSGGSLESKIMPIVYRRVPFHDDFFLDGVCT